VTARGPDGVSRRADPAVRLPRRVDGRRPVQSRSARIVRTVWGTAAAVWAAVALASLPAAVDALSPDIRSPETTGPPATPTAVRTSHSAPDPIRINKTELIIMQNPNCWIGGQPGATCGPERTYR